MSSAPIYRPEIELFIYCNGKRQRFLLRNALTTIGRRPDRDIVLPEPHVSREHAQIISEADGYYVVDQASRQGTFVNGERISRKKLHNGDRVDIGEHGGTYIVFGVEPINIDKIDKHESTAREFMSQVINIGRGKSEDAKELETLRLYLEAARSLNTTGVVTDVLVTLIEMALRLTQAERGFVFLREDTGELTLAAGRNATGQPLTEAKGISQSALQHAIRGASEFLFSGTDLEIAERQSIVAHDLRTVVCIPLRTRSLRNVYEIDSEGSHAIGVLYLDSHLITGNLSDVSHELLRSISREAAALVENAYLVRAEQETREYQKELAIASSIQQSLMEVKLPALSFASVDARSISCKEIGGDFYDVVRLEDGVAIVIADVSGKGISAALLASILQGVVYPQISEGVSLCKIAEMVNRYIYDRVEGRKYATMVMARLYSDGRLEYINCGHIKPALCRGNSVSRLDNGNLPVGLLTTANFADDSIQLSVGDRLMFVTDGVIEAANAADEFFGEERLDAAMCMQCSVKDLFREIDIFRQTSPLQDDCTALALKYLGR